MRKENQKKKKKLNGFAQNGYIPVGVKPPDECPARDHPTKYFQIVSEAF
jgi:hypothetical protein